MYASNSHSYTHLILALGIVSEPTVWVFITSKYRGIHDIGLANNSLCGTFVLRESSDEIRPRGFIHMVAIGRVSLTGVVVGLKEHTDTGVPSTRLL